MARTELPKPHQSSSAPESASDATIFTNIGHGALNRYVAGPGVLVTGDDVPFEPEIWEALPFTPKTDVHVTVLSAAIGYYSGTKKVNLGIYSDSSGTVGAPLPGDQGSTSDIPDTGDCCQLTTVTLPGAGVSLTGGVQY